MNVFDKIAPFVTFGIVGFLIVAGGGFAWWGNEERRLARALDEISKSSTSQSYISDFDYVCFNFNNMNVKDEFSAEARRLNQRFALSLESCGLNRSCCNLNSDSSGAIGLVNNDAIRCVEMNRFMFITASNQPICVKPAQLIVARKIFLTRTNPPGRPWVGNPGDTYYEISSK